MFNGLHLPALPKPQFRAVVLCGYGSDLFPLIEPSAGLSSSDDDDDAKEDGTPPAPALQKHAKHHTGQVKALLPVAGKKMIDWVLDRVEEAGVFDTLVLTPASVALPLVHHLKTRRATSSGSSTGKVDLEEVSDDIARRGAVAVLRWAVERGFIKTDFIVLPCDLLLAPSSSNTLTLASLIDRHRIDDNLFTTLLLERKAGNVVDVSKDGPPEILTIYDAPSSTLLDLRELDASDDSDLSLRTSLLSRFPSPTLSTNLLPSQLYIFSSSILPLLLSPSHDRRLRHLENLRELASWIASLAWRSGGKDGVCYRDRGSLRREDGIALGRSTTQRAVGSQVAAGLGDEVEDDDDLRTGQNTPARPGLKSRSSEVGSAWDHDNGRSEMAAGGKKKAVKGSGGCKVVIWRVADGWCARGNTVPGWVELNRAAIKLLPPSPAPTNTPTGVFISPDSFLHPSVYANLSEKVGIKRCIFGKGCVVGKGSKITNVVAMEGVVIGENVKLENCVLSNGVQIRDRAVLKDCELGRDFIVQAGEELKNEQLVVEDEG